MYNNCLKVGIAVIGLLLVIATITSLISHCPEERVEFVDLESPEVVHRIVEVPCGAHEAHIPCKHTVDGRPGTIIPYWIINSTKYLSLPDGYEISGTSLVVKNVEPELNNTHFFCQIELVSRSNPSMTCKYNSSLHQLIIKKCDAPKVKCMPVYSHKSGNLRRIHTTFNLTELEVDGIATAYTIVYSNSLGNECDSFTIPDPISNCTEEICSHVFELSTGSSWCSNTSNISVIVSTTNSDASVNFWKSETMIIDTLNRFVELKFVAEKSVAICTFLSQSLAIRKECALKYGPVSLDCRNSNLSDPVKYSETDQMFVQLEGIDLSYLGNVTKFCVSVFASSGNKEVIIEGIYDVAEQTLQPSQKTVPSQVFTARSGFQVQTSSRLVCSIELLTVAMMYVL